MPPTRRPYLLLAATLVLAACTSTGSPPTAAQTGISTPTGPASSLLTPSPLATSEPTSSPPPTSAAGPAALIARTITCNDTCGPNPGTTILSDGRVIWRPEDAPGDGLAERTLTPAGLEAVTTAIDATGLLEASGSYRPELRPGKTAPGHGTIRHDIQTVRDGQPVSVDTLDPVTFEADNETLGRVWDIPDEAYALSDLAAKLGDPEAWLPPDAWVDARHPYEPQAFLLLVTRAPSADLPPYPDVDEVAWPVASRIETAGERYAVRGETVARSRCLPMSRDVALAMIQAERAVGQIRSITDPQSELSYAWARGPGMVHVALRQLLPDQLTSCLGGGTW